MDESTIIIVTGLQRSGTALIMQILEAAGLPLLIDDVRKADEHNVNGYYEHSQIPTIKFDDSFLKQAVGKCVKIYAAFIPALPKNNKYKFIEMNRPMGELVPSLKRKFNERDDFLPANKITQIERIFERSKKYISSLPNAEVLSIDFNTILDNPEQEIKRILNFLNITVQLPVLIKIVDKKLQTKNGVIGLVKTDRGPIDTYKLIEKYSEGKVFCEIGIGEGENLYKVSNAKKKFGIEKSPYSVLRCKEKYPDLKVYHGDALELIQKHPFEVCYLWIVYPINKLIVDKVFEHNPDCVVLMGINYFYHLKRSDPKYLKYISLYTGKARADSWNENFDTHRQALLADGYTIEIEEVEDETSEKFSIAVISKNKLES